MPLQDQYCNYLKFGGVFKKIEKIKNCFNFTGFFYMDIKQFFQIGKIKDYFCMIKLHF